MLRRTHLRRVKPAWVHFEGKRIYLFIDGSKAEEKHLRRLYASIIRSRVNTVVPLGLIIVPSDGYIWFAAGLAALGIILAFLVNMKSRFKWVRYLTKKSAPAFDTGALVTTATVAVKPPQISAVYPRTTIVQKAKLNAFDLSGLILVLAAIIQLAYVNALLNMISHLSDVMGVPHMLIEKLISTGQAWLPTVAALTFYSQILWWSVPHQLFIGIISAALTTFGLYLKEIGAGIVVGSIFAAAHYLIDLMGIALLASTVAGMSSAILALYADILQHTGLGPLFLSTILIGGGWKLGLKKLLGL
jgi:hypothetical protein